MDKINKKVEAVKSVDFKNLPKVLQVKLNRALDNYKSGNYISNEEMKVKAKKWLLEN